MKKLFAFLFTLSCFFSYPLFSYQYDLSICLIFQNEAPYLKEWIEFHRLLGVDHFYLYNNLSTDNYQQVLKPYIRKGIVDLVEWPHPADNVQEWDKIQVAAYQHAWLKAIGQTKWLAFLDSDEFLFPVRHTNLPKFLTRYEKENHIGGVCVNWVMYGTSGVKKIPEDKLLIETLVYSQQGGHDHFKSIVRPERVAEVCSPHYVHYQKGICHCTPSNKPVLPPCIEIDQLRINHYWSRDEWYLNEIKIPRRLKWGTPPEVCQQWTQANNSMYNDAILRFVPALRKKMGLDR